LHWSRHIPTQKPSGSHSWKLSKQEKVARAARH
jgi:hypothetical protein